VIFFVQIYLNKINVPQKKSQKKKKKKEKEKE
jgi:hypothetical protein